MNVNDFDSTSKLNTMYIVYVPIYSQFFNLLED